jgi:hypothetical protein
MLECVQSFSKFAQTQYAFICDFIAIFKSCQGIFIKCIMMSKQVSMGIMILIDYWKLHMDHCDMFYIMFGFLNHLQGLNMQYFSFTGGVTCYINTTH